MGPNQHVLVSIIIPCYNVEEYILECLESVVSQTYPHFEVIVVDNNCSDNTMRLVESFVLRTQNISIHIAREMNQGLSFARNSGIKLAKGEWIQFLDADDLLLPDKIEHQIKLINSEVDLIAAATLERNLDGNEVIMRPHKNRIYGLIAGYRNVGSSCSNLWRKSILDSLNGFDTEQKSSVEIDLMFRIFVAEGNIINDNEPKTIIRKRASGQMSQGKASELAKNWISLRVRQIRFVLEKGISFDTSDEFLAIYSMINFRILIQYQDYPDLSHTQYHAYFEQFIIKFRHYLPLKERIKVLVYKVLGYNNVRKAKRVLT